MLRKALGESVEGAGEQSADADAAAEEQEQGQEQDQMSALGTPLTPRSTGTASRTNRLGAAQGPETPLLRSGQSIAESLRMQLTLPAEFGAGAGEEDVEDDGAGGVLEQPLRPEYPVNIASDDLQILFSKRPELLEFLYLEIESMRIQTARLTSKNSVQQQLHREHT